MNLNYSLIFVATLAQFVLGAVWYSPLMFGKWWMKFMDCENLSASELKKIQKEMMPFYGLQLILTLITTVSLAKLLMWLPDMNAYSVANIVFIGFLAPTQIASVVWGKTEKRFWFKQVFVMVSNSFVGIMLATWILGM